MARHSERCKMCKETVARLLEKAFGQVCSQYSLDLPARLQGYKGKPHYDELARIYEALKRYRGHDSFVRTDRLPKVDYYLPKQRTVVEFDESQHFTRPRHITLSFYPADLELGFDRQRWMELAKCLDRHDNDPIYRDEQRAWYDTLRDFSAAVLGNAPTVRLLARERQWCLLDPENLNAVDLFLEMYFEDVQSAYL